MYKFHLFVHSVRVNVRMPIWYIIYAWQFIRWQWTIFCNHCYCFTCFRIFYPVKNCPRLSVLELDHMCEIGEDDARSLCAVGLKGLEELDFTFTPVTPKAILYFISTYIMYLQKNINETAWTCASGQRKLQAVIRVIKVIRFSVVCGEL